MSKKKKRHHSRNGREPRYQREERRHEQVIPGYYIQSSPNGTLVYLPTGDPKLPKSKSKNKFKWNTASVEQVELIATKIFGGSTYFCYQDLPETDE